MSVETSAPVADEVRPATMFVSSRTITLLDHFRVPYRVDPALAADDVQQLRTSNDGPSLLWLTSPDARPTAAVTNAPGGPEISLFAGMLPDNVVASRVAELDGSWHRARSLTGHDSELLGSIWRSDRGDVLLPFSPDEVILNYWSERYLEIASGPASRRLRRGMMIAYYQVRPLIPRPIQIWLRRRFARIQGRSRFPRWPVETSLHDFFDLMFGILAAISGGPVPSIAPWPHGFTWALVLTHDVELADGWAAVDPVLDLERAHGMRSSWNLVERRCYNVSIERVRELVADGFEVGVHGLYHDGRDLASIATLQERLPAIRDAASRWGAVGFRAPAMHRRWEWMPLLGLEYDSSYPDSDPFEPQTGGCCTWLPFFNEGILELPVTLIQDHTLFVILRRDEAAWAEKTRFLRDRGGLALIDTHPDYLVDERILRAYGNFLDEFTGDPTAWRALPRDVNAWWRSRAKSSLEWHEGEWRVVGPASDDARIEFLAGSGWQPAPEVGSMNGG